MKALFLTVLLAISCKKYSPLSREAASLRLTDVQMGISELNQVDWKVGKWKDSTVSQSFTFMVDMPKVSDEDLEQLNKIRGIDSWIVRLIVERRSDKQDLGSLYAHFLGKKIIRGSGGGAPSSVALKVFYAAAYPSERFRFFQCPAFNHRFKIKSMKIQGEDTPFDLSIDQVTHYGEKSHLVGPSPTAFNAGNSFVGEYFVEIAAYDSEKKDIHGSFKRIPLSIEVSQEEQISVPSCDGVHQENQ
jgi:hypothetical protein